MLKLSVGFENSVGKAHRWSFNEPNKDLANTEVQEQMEKLTELGLFAKDGTQLFAEVKNAKFVETIETPLF